MHRLRRAQTAKTVRTNTIGRFLLVGLTSPLGVSNLRYVSTRPKNVAHLGGTIECRTHLSDNDNHSHSQQFFSIVVDESVL
jgi:hypothetical protein